MSAPETDGFKCDVSAYGAPVVIELGDDGEQGVAKRLYKESRERGEKYGGGADESEGRVRVGAWSECECLSKVVLPVGKTTRRAVIVFPIGVLTGENQNMKCNFNDVPRPHLCWKSRYNTVNVCQNRKYNTKGTPTSTSRYKKT